MGSTLKKLATEISKKDIDKQLWEKGQVVVILSRTHTASETIFVTEDINDTLDHLCELLLKTTQYGDYIDHLLNILNVDVIYNNIKPLEMQNFPFRICDIEIPDDNSGFVYCLLSTQDYNTTYIGQTFNLRRRLKEHNSGYGAKQTEAEIFRPWALAAFVCGFKKQREYMLQFEKRWEKDSTICEESKTIIMYFQLWKVH